MKTKHLLLTLATLCSCMTLSAQDMTALSCEDFRPTPTTLIRFANLAGACEGVVDRDGELYAKFSATVRRVRGNDLTLHLPATDNTFTVKADASKRVLMDGRKVRPRDLERGDEIQIYLSVSEFAKPDIEDIVLISDLDVLLTVEVEQVAALPTTASMWPTIGASGLLLLGVGYMLRRRRNITGAPIAVLLVGVLLGGTPTAEADHHAKTIQVPGRLITSAVQKMAIVESVNKETREIKVIDASGQRSSFVAGDMVANFDQIEPRDRIVVEQLESVAVFVAPAGTPALGDASTVELAPLGDKPGMKAVDTFMVSATVEALNVTDRTATIRDEDGTVRTIRVSDDVPLELVKVGDEVRLRITQAIAISVRKAGGS